MARLGQAVAGEFADAAAESETAPAEWSVATPLSDAEAERLQEERDRLRDRIRARSVIIAFREADVKLPFDSCGSHD